MFSVYFTAALLSLAGVQGAPTASWRQLQEFPASIFAGHGFSERCNFSLTNREGTSAFWIFGGRDQNGELLSDLYVFDMAEEQWHHPEVLNADQAELPAPREHHAACFVADRYLVCYGGVDAAGNLLADAVVYDVITCKWSTVTGIEPRAKHRLVNRGGVLYLLGGVGEGDVPAEPMPLQSQVFPFAQNNSLDFVGNNAQAVVVKPSPGLSGLRNVFSVEAVFYARSFEGNSHNPVLVKTDNGLKTGFGLIGQQHPAFKGDAEEGPWIHFFVGQWSQGGHQMVGFRIELNTWNHVVATFNGSEINLYVNGSLRATQNEYVCTEEEAETLHSKGDLYIGGMPGKYAFDGFIDECRVWDICLQGDDEIKRFMNKPMCEDRMRNLLGQWTFNEGSGELVIDSSGQRNHASFDTYAGGIELRRVQSHRPFIEAFKSEREKHIDENFEKLQVWKNEFEKENGRQPTKAELMMHPEMGAIARRLGEFGVD